MEFDPEALRRQFADLSDKGLLAIDRKDLVDLAQQYYDAEIAQRALHPSVEAIAEQVPDEELVPVATYLSLEEARMGRALLETANIPAKLENEFSSAWTGFGGLRLMVPVSLEEEAAEVLESRISDEELARQAEAAEPVERALKGEEDDEV